MKQVNTVTGPVPIDSLGRTLMHEHLMVGFPGWESDRLRPGLQFRDLVARCVDRIEELKAAGFSTLLDPCPNDMGRDVNLMAEVATRTGFNIICSTGLYYDSGGLSHWKLRFMLDPSGADRLAELFVQELTEGIDGTGIKAGIVKLATEDKITPYDHTVFMAGAKAAIATGAPITTHTAGILGDAQIALLKGCGVPAHRVIIGHSCGSNDHAYHMRILREGAYIGFDRFGLEATNSDANRVASMQRIMQAGAADRVIVSHDCVWCVRGMEGVYDKAAPTHEALRFTRVIAPMLKKAGVTDAEIDALLRNNPRRFFANEALPPIE